MPENTYGQPWSRQYRGLLVFLLDQSISMQEKRLIGGKAYTNGQMATATLNDLIYTMIKNTTVDPETGQLKDYCDILVLGYGDQVVPLVHAGNGQPMTISVLATHPRGDNTVLAERFDSALNRVVRIKRKEALLGCRAVRGPLHRDGAGPTSCFPGGSRLAGYSAPHGLVSSDYH